MTPQVHSDRPRVVIACGGVGFANRGFETLARECFEALKRRDELDVMLVKGRGPRLPDERVAPTFGRDSRAALIGARLLGRDTFYVENAGFTASIIPILARRKPHVVYLSEWWLGRGLARWRRRTGARYRLLLSNGGPYPPERFGHVDHVHQLTPHELERAVDAGVPRERQTLLELGVGTVRADPPTARIDCTALRSKLGLPRERAIVLSVAALAFHHKRMDYVVREVAAMSEPRPFLVMLGQHQDETPRLLALADELLGADGYTARTVAPAEVTAYYDAADVFVLGSLWEAFGLVMVEALGHGLPCVVHDGPTQRFVLGAEGDLAADFTKDGALARALPDALRASDDEEARARRRRAAYERFAWERLAPRYADMMCQCASSASA
jgi:glycosyltransferase involved in cell wall biosynthesis